MNETKRKRFGLRTGVGVTGALLGVTITGATLTTTTQSREDNSRRLRATSFPFVSIPRTQGLRLNATYVAPPEPSVAPPDPDRPDCAVRLRLLDSEGRVVGNQTATLAPGKTGQLGFTAPPDPGIPVGIQGVRAEVAVPRGRCQDAVVSSMEIIDIATGEVRSVVGPALKASQLLTAPPEPDSQERN